VIVAGDQSGKITVQALMMTEKEKTLIAGWPISRNVPTQFQ
jgi:hypothetical protein